MKETEPDNLAESVHRLTHELNGPLSAIIGFSELLMEGPLDIKVRKDVEKIHQEALRMSNILNDFVLSSRMP